VRPHKHKRGKEENARRSSFEWGRSIRWIANLKGRRKKRLAALAEGEERAIPRIQNCGNTCAGDPLGGECKNSLVREEEKGADFDDNLVLSL